MQSMNEELQTVNQELQSKVEDLSRVNNDMKNLLDSTDIATLFLDDALNVRRFTPEVLKIIKLIPGDQGRPITDLASDLVYPELADDAREVLRQPGVQREGDCDLRRALVHRAHHALPHARQPVDGVVITFLDITAAKTWRRACVGTQTGEGKGE